MKRRPLPRKARHRSGVYPDRLVESIVAGKSESEVGVAFGGWGEGWIEEDGRKNFAKKSGAIFNSSLALQTAQVWRCSLSGNNRTTAEVRSQLGDRLMVGQGGLLCCMENTSAMRFGSPNRFPTSKIGPHQDIGPHGLSAVSISPINRPFLLGSIHDSFSLFNTRRTLNHGEMRPFINASKSTSSSKSYLSSSARGSPKSSNWPDSFAPGSP